MPGVRGSTPRCRATSGLGGRLRRWAGVTVAVVALAVVLGAALLTRFPEWPVLERAERAPFVGSAIGAFRARYLPRESEQPAHGLTEFELVERTVGARETVWVDAGSVVRSAPKETSEPVATLDSLANLPLVERHGEWVRVEVAGETGWVVPRTESDGPVRGSRPAPVLPLPSRAPDAAVLARGLAFFGSEPVEFPFGDYRLFTDRRDPGLVGRCQAVESGLEAAYAERFALAPVGRAAEAVLIFSRRADYEAFWRRTTGRAVAFTGHADRGVAATFVDLRSAREVCATVAHELTHLINRRAVGPALPPWLEEGLAIDMASRHAGETDYSGAARAAAAAGSLPPVAEFLALDTDAFHLPSRLRLHYGFSGLWMRFLLESPELAAGLRGFLAYLSVGGPWGPEVERRPELAVAAATPSLVDDLEVFLGASAESLNQRFSRWVRSL